MDEQGIESWNKTNYLARFPESYFFEKCHSSELYVLHEAAVLLTEDSRWNTLPPAHAYYLHNLVSAPNMHGASRRILREKRLTIK